MALLVGPAAVAADEADEAERPEIAGTDQCVACHFDDESMPEGWLVADIHLQAGLSCAGCHGGDPTSIDEDEAMSEAGLESLCWLTDLQRTGSEGGHFAPIGSNGFHDRGGECARFDQQPVEAQTTASACLEAYRSTGDQRWRKEARLAFEWFLGRNDLNAPIYDFKTGGCCDGLQPDGPNKNQGAESTLAWLISLLTLLKLIATRNLADNRGDESEQEESGDSETVDSKASGEDTDE